MEVFLSRGIRARTLICLLHVRGGVSFSRLRRCQQRKSSPRPWRCFQDDSRRQAHVLVFSTSVEVFPNGVFGSVTVSSLLHVRGGVSPVDVILGTGLESSPRPWRCFYSLRPQVFSLRVFSTSVEVFPGPAGFQSGFCGSSPRPWRCFCTCSLRRSSGRVFSTSVEVFPFQRDAKRPKA